MNFLKPLKNSRKIERIKESSREVIVSEKSAGYLKEVAHDTTPSIKAYEDHTVITFEKNSLPSTILRSRGRNKFNFLLESDYDLAYMERLYEKEGIIRKFVATASAKILRAEFNLVESHTFLGSKAERKKRHTAITNGLQDILSASDVTWFEMLQTTAKEVLEYGNTFINLIPKKQKLDSIILDDPLFYQVNIDPSSLNIKSYVRSPYIRPKSYSEDTFNSWGKHLTLYSSVTANDEILRDAMKVFGQKWPGSHGVYKPQTISKENIIHIRYMIEKNAAMALPPAMASAVDIEDLRALEENLILLGWQYGHPILHITINSEGLTPAQLNTEINEVIRAVEAMDSTGFLATSNRVKVQLHYPNGSVVPIDKFAEYLQSRIKGNLDTAGLLLGDGKDAGRQAGEAIESASNDINHMIANVIAGRLQMRLIDRIYGDLYPDQSLEKGVPTRIKVSEIDRNRSTARTNQLINLLNSSGVSPDVVREHLGLPPIDDEEQKKIIDHAAIRKSSLSDKTVNPSNQYGETTPGTTKD